MGKITDGFGHAKSTSQRREVEWENLAEFLGLDENMSSEAMSEATYYACTKILRETLGKLPLRLMRRRADGGIETMLTHPLYDTLCVRPNRFTSAPAFWASVEQQRNHCGNAYVHMTGENTEKDPMELWVMPFEEVQVVYDDLKILANVPDIYYVWSHGGNMYVLKSYEVMHFRSSDTIDGVMGIPLIDRLKGVVNGSIRSQEFQNDLISSGLTAKAVLQYTSNLNDDMVKEFVRHIEEYAQGKFAGNGIKNIIPLPVGSTLTPLNTKLTDAQFEELKKYSAVQIASAFGIKPQQIGDMTKQSYASSQAQQEAFYTDTMLYILNDYESEVTFKTLTRKARHKGYFVQFDTSVMLRSDYKTTVEANKIAIESGQLTPNEARAKLNLPSEKDGDILLGNGNLIPISMAGQQYVNDSSEGGERDEQG